MSNKAESREIISEVDVRHQQLKNIDEFESKLASLISASIDLEDPGEIYDKSDTLKREFLENLLNTFKDSGIDHVSSYYENFIYGIFQDRIERTYSKFRALNRIHRTIEKCNDQLGGQVLSASFDEEEKLMNLIDSLFFIEKMCQAWGVPQYASEISRRWMDKTLK